MLIRHSAQYLAGRTVSGAVSLLALALYTRLLTADQYGHYALVIAAAGIVSAVCFQWLTVSLGRFLPAHENQPQGLLSTTLAAFLVLIALTGTLGIAIGWLWPDHTLRLLIILAFVVGWAQAWFDLNLKVVNVRLTPIRYGLLTSLRALLAVTAGAALFYLGLGVIGILLGLVIGLVIPTLLVWKTWHGSSIGRHDTHLLKTLLAYGAPITVTLLLTLVLDISDRFLLAWILNARAVGAYAAAYDLTQQSLGMLMGVVHLAAFPLALRATEGKDDAATRTQLRQNAHLLLGISLPAVVGLLMLADNVAFVMLGPDFREGAGYIIVVVALAIFVGGVRSYYFDYSFQLARKMRGQVWTVLWAALANVGLNLWWIPKYGVRGAAYATFVALLIGLFVSWYLGQKVYALPAIPKEVYKSALAAGGMAATLVPTTNWRGPAALICQVLLGCVVYALLIIILDAGHSRLRLATLLRGIEQKLRRGGPSR